jgi:hypothetical protein
VIVATPNDDSFLGLAINGILNMPPHHVTRWTSSALRYILEFMGLVDVVIDTEPLAEIHEEWFFNQMLVRAFLNARRDGVPLVRADLGFRVINTIARRMARWLMRGNLTDHPVAVGHSIVGIGLKP